MEVELSWLCSVVRRHCPVFFLHPADRYLPCSAEFFLQHSELRVAAPGGGHAVLLPRESVAGPLLADAQRQHPGRRLWLELDPAARTGEPLERLDEVPVYAHPRHVISASGEVEAIEIVYITIYAYNGAYKVGGLPWLQTGAHDGDIEHLTVRVHPTSGALQGVWYNAHRSRDGCWVAAPQVPRCATTGRIAAYVALHGHGTYPAVGRVFRHFFCGNDLCSDAGPAWRPRRTVLLPPVHGPGSPPLGGGGASQRRLMQVPSRGSLLPPVADGSPEGGAGCSSGTNSGGSGENGSIPNGGSARNGSIVSGGGSDGSDGLPEVLADECCAWLEFMGQWGTTDAPAVQAWFSNAEPPVSRSALQRLFLHPWPEPKSV